MHDSGRTCCSGEEQLQASCPAPRWSLSLRPLLWTLSCAHQAISLSSAGLTYLSCISAVPLSPTGPSLSPTPLTPTVHPLFCLLTLSSLLCSPVPVSLFHACQSLSSMPASPSLSHVLVPLSLSGLSCAHSLVPTRPSLSSTGLTYSSCISASPSLTHWSLSLGLLMAESREIL